MDEKFSKLEANLYRLNLVSTSLKLLLQHCYNNDSCSVIASKYGMLELANFIKYHESLMGILHGNEKKVVLCLNDYVVDVIKLKDSIKYMRNNWIGHIQENRNLVKEFSMYGDNLGLPKNSDEEFLLFSFVVIFVEELTEFLNKARLSSYRKLLKNYRPVEYYPFDEDEIEKKLQRKKSNVEKNLHRIGLLKRNL